MVEMVRVESEMEKGSSGVSCWQAWGLKTGWLIKLCRQEGI